MLEIAGIWQLMYSVSLRNFFSTTMRFSLEVLLLILLAVSMAVGSPIGRAFKGLSTRENKQLSPAQPLSPPQADISPIYVENLAQAAQLYPEILGDPASQAVFVLKDTNTYLARAQTGIPPRPADGPAENIDHISPRGFRDRLMGIAENFQGEKDTTGAAPHGEDTEWVEHSYENPQTRKYPGYIPISACQSQQLGQSGSVSFSYSFGGSFGGNNNIGISVTSMMITASLTAGISISESFTIGGTTSCTIPAGTIGQVMLKPEYLSLVPLSRRMSWVGKARSFMTDGAFSQYDTIHVLLSLNTFQVDCVTSDIVPLFCEGTKLGVPNWENPLGVGYHLLGGHGAS